MQEHRSWTLRKGRQSEDGRVYLVTTVTEGRQRLFSTWTTGRMVVAELRAAADAGLVESLAWVLMPDHLHWLLALNGQSLPQVMRQVKGRSATRLNACFGRTGPIWQRGYHDHALRRDEDVRDVARYVVANPVRAGLVRKAGDYPLWDAIWL